ncbi:hypothetical protein PLESTF_000670100 [Pleodorina starrii]|nr:hypothetical protein PLESTF_000670100 [Pleodorina starrii]
MSVNRDDGETSSQRSGNSGTSGNMSETSSQQSDSKFLRKRALRAQHGENGEETDLLEQKRNLQEGVFACMYTLVRQSALSQLSFAVLKIVLEFLMSFIVTFNPSFSSWKIDTSSPVWQVVRWTVWRSPIMRLYGYRTYVIVMYIMAAAVLLAVLALVWLTLAMRKQEQSKGLRMAASAVHVAFDIMFVMCYVSFFDYFVFMADCDFLGTKSHLYFTGVACLEMPHLLHMMVAMTTALLFLCVTALLVVASAELNPVAQGYLSSPAALVRLRVLFAKAVYIIFANCVDSNPRLQCIGMTASVLVIVYWNFRAMPFYRKPINVVWTGLWAGILYTVVVLDVVTFGKDQSAAQHRLMTKIVLYGIFGAIALGMALTALYVWWAMRPARKFRDLQPGVKLSKVHKFESVYEVERLARVMRKFDRDDLVEEDAAALGEAVIKAGLQAFPNAPHLLILYANFVLEVRKDGPAARTQLQLAAKHSPNIIQRYQIFCTYEASKRLKGNNQQECMDLQAYMEFKRNFRAVLRVHREVLMMQAEIWQLCMRPSLRVMQFDNALDALENASTRANQVYKRVLERYPNNGKLLRCYGKFLEDARHDHVAAARAYTEANRSGAGAGMLALDLSSGLHGVGKPEFLTSMSMEDDAVVVIDAEGTIMMVSQTVQKTFGYAKAELEGANVSILMPQPFSQRHAGYLQRYVSTGEPHILDSVREVVALHKDRYVFPVALCVTKLSGVGSDSIFLGLIRPLPPDIYNLRAWVAPNGVFLCSDQQFASAIGVVEGELVGHPLSSLLAVPEAAEALLERCRAATAEDLDSGEITTELVVKHRYREAVPMHVTVRLAGTDTQRILALYCRRTDGLDGSMLAVDTHMRIKFASCEVALLLGYSMRKLATMRLDQLLPQPFNTLHAKWLRDPPHVVPAASCRSGSVVYLQSASSGQIPVRLQISTLDGPMMGAAASTGSTLYVVQVRKAPAEELFKEKRLVLTADFAGRVLAASPLDSSVFGFPALSLVGTNLAESVDIFADWRERSGETQMQLIVLALLYKEQEMPGTSWRVRVHEPDADDVKGISTALPSQPSVQKAAGSRARLSVTACLQVEMLEEADVLEEDAMGGGAAGEHEPRVRITLWRRDLLSGVVELDEELVIRRASPLTGLITGLPTTAMLRKPLSRFLNLPHVTSWEKLVAASGHQGHGHHKKSALKATNDRGSISPVMAFIGPHPDTGTMRLMVQGVQTLGPGGRPKITITLHPDTTFVGAHADLMRVLKLDEGSNRRTSNCGADCADEDGALSVANTRTQSRGTSAAKSRAAKRLKSRKPPPPPQQDTAADAVEEEEDAAAAGGLTATDTAKAMPQSAGTKADAGQGAELTKGGRQARRSLSSAEDSGEDAGGEEAVGRPGEQQLEDEKCDDVAGSEGDGEGAASRGPAAASLHHRTTSKSEFVSAWVRTLSHQMSGRVGQDEQEQQRQPPGTATSERGREGRSGASLAPAAESARTPPPAAVASGAGALVRLPTIMEGPLADTNANSLALLAPDPAAQEGVLLRVVSMREWADAAGPRGGSPASQGIEVSRRATMHEDVDTAAVTGKVEKAAASEDGDSSADGSQATGSVISSATDATSMTECVIDARRGRLLKALGKLLLGPAFLKHVDRLRLQSYLLIAVMFIAHIISYTIITELIKKEHDNVYSVHRQAMAMDRSQLIVVRSIAGAFCERANVTKTSVCANTLNFTLTKLQTNIHLMEEYHHGVYLGFDTSKVARLQTDVYDIWTQHALEYHVYMDTSPPQVVVEKAGAWQLGNRFLAAAREALYLLPKIGDKYKLHRTYQFLKTNGLGPLFEGYAASLDLLVDAAWLSIKTLKKDLIVTLVVEAIVVQLCCTCYQLYLVQQAEWARLLGVLAILGLPGPVLRQLANSDTRIVGDSDDEFDGDDDDSRGGDEEVKGGGGRGAASQGGAEHDGNDGALDAAAAATAQLPAAGPGPRVAVAANDGAIVSLEGRRPAESDPASREAAAVRRSSSTRTPPSRDRSADVQEEVAAVGASQSSFPADAAAGTGSGDRGEGQAAAGGGLAHQCAGSATMRVVSPCKGVRARAAGGKHRYSRSRLLINGKTLQPSLWNVSKFMVRTKTEQSAVQSVACVARLAG